MLTIFCPQCYAQNRQDDEVCRSCGAELRGADGDYVERLVRFSLHHPVPTVSAMAAQILGGIGDKRAVEPLMCALNDSTNPGLQESAAEALGRLGDAHAVPALSEALRRAPLAVRIRAAAALGEIGGEAAIAALHGAMSTDPSANVREEARLGLTRVAEGRVAESRDGGNDPSRGSTGG
jgi:HEAT repeat protein